MIVTEHITRWREQNDIDFISSAKNYRRFKNVTSYEHSFNIDYLTKRCNELGYDFVPACCGKFTISKKETVK